MGRSLELRWGLRDGWFVYSKGEKDIFRNNFGPLRRWTLLTVHELVFLSDDFLIVSMGGSREDQVYIPTVGQVIRSHTYVTINNIFMKFPHEYFSEAIYPLIG